MTIISFLTHLVEFFLLVGYNNPMRKIGIYGGTFDPPHLGHNEMLLQAQSQLELDFTVVLPCGEPVHKKTSTDKAKRLDMCRLAFSGEKNVVVSDFEIFNTEKNYTLTTLRHFAEIYADSHLYYIIGSDSLEDFPKWYHPEQISELATIVVAPRANTKFSKAKEYAEKTYGADVVVLKEEPLNISSSELRCLFQFGLDTSQYIDKDVAEYIKKNKLYSEHAEICSKVRSFLDKGRYLHTFYTTMEGLKLAKLLNVDKEKVFFACLLHDVAKNTPQSDWSKYSFENTENLPPPVVHSFLGALVAKQVFGINDEEILNAIKYHTTGRPDMTRLEQIVYVADMIEITRGANLDEVRKKVYADFDEGFLLCLKSSYNCAARRFGAENVYKLTKESIKFYRKLSKEKNEKRKIG